MSKMRALAPLLLAAFVLAMTSVLAYADAGPKHKFSSMDAVQMDAATIVSDAGCENAENSHGDVVSCVANNWNNLESKDAYKGFNKGEIMRIVAQSDIGKGNNGEGNEGNGENNTPTPTSTLSASYSSSPPTSWNTGETKTYSITITNTGSDTWNASGTNPVRLGVEFGTSDDTPNVGWATNQRFDLPNDVAPGASVTLSVNVTAPTTAGSYVLRHRMVKEGVAWFAQIQKTDVTVGTTSTSTVITNHSGDRGNGRGVGHNR